MATIDLKTGGMHCSSCSMLIEMALGDLPGVTSASVDYPRSTSHVEFDPTALTADDIIDAIVHAGYTAEIAH